VGNPRTGGGLQKRQANPRVLEPSRSSSAEHSCEPGNARGGLVRESGPTTQGGKPVKRRKPRRASASRSANPRPVGTASRREQDPEGGFPCSSLHPRHGTTPRAIPNESEESRRASARCPRTGSVTSRRPWCRSPMPGRKTRRGYGTPPTSARDRKDMDA
jgi:hypothetical protein